MLLIGDEMGEMEFRNQQLTADFVHQFGKCILLMRSTRNGLLVLSGSGEPVDHS